MAKRFNKPCKIKENCEVKIRVGDSVLRTSSSNLVQDLKDHEKANSGFVNYVEYALRNRNKPVTYFMSISQDGKIEFKRDPDFEDKFCDFRDCTRVDEPGFPSDEVLVPELADKMIEEIVFFVENRDVRHRLLRMFKEAF